MIKAIAVVLLFCPWSAFVQTLPGSSEKKAPVTTPEPVALPAVSAIALMVLNPISAFLNEAGIKPQRIRPHVRRGSL